MMAERSPLPADIAVTVPVYSPGVRVEAYQDPDRHLIQADVSIQLARQVEVTEELAMRYPHPSGALQESIERAVRQMQDEAVRELGLNHWRAEVEREVRADEVMRMRARLDELLDTVRTAKDMNAAALVVLDAIRELS